MSVVVATFYSHLLFLVHNLIYTMNRTSFKLANPCTSLAQRIKCNVSKKLHAGKIMQIRLQIQQIYAVIQLMVIKSNEKIFQEASTLPTLA